MQVDEEKNATNILKFPGDKNRFTPIDPKTAPNKYVGVSWRWEHQQTHIRL